MCPRDYTYVFACSCFCFGDLALSLSVLTPISGSAVLVNLDLTAAYRRVQITVVF